SEKDEELIDELCRHALVASAKVGCAFSGFFHQVPICRHLRSMVEERRISGCVLRAMAMDSFNVARVSHHCCVLFQRFNKGHWFLLLSLYGTQISNPRVLNIYGQSLFGECFSSPNSERQTDLLLSGRSESDKQLAGDRCHFQRGKFSA